MVKLQSGDPDTLIAWKKICDISRIEFANIYKRLQVHPNLIERGESFYNNFLKSIVTELEEKKVAVSSEGATCVFVPGYINQDGTPQPLIVRKADGGFLYASTDLAAIKHRVNEEKATRLLYGKYIKQLLLVV